LELTSFRNDFYAQIGNMPVPEAVGQPKSVLDIGAGTGDWAVYVAFRKFGVACLHLIGM